MTQPPTMEQPKSFFRNDRKLVCSMLVIYGLCILGGIAAVVWGLNGRRLALSNSATSTAQAAAIEQVQGTATVAARRTEQAQYKFIDPFNNNNAYWLTESSNDEYMSGSIAINGGIYAWNIQQVKQPFIYWSDFRGGTKYEDFDVYVDTKVSDAAPGDACSGFIFRTASADWEEGTYTFSICNNSTFIVDYYEQGEWEMFANSLYSASIRNEDWNRMEIQARGSDFRFFINDEVVYEMKDDRQPTGGLGLFIEVNKTRPVSIWFDNFGFQMR